MGSSEINESVPDLQIMKVLGVEKWPLFKRARR